MESPFTTDGFQWAWDATSIRPAKECWRRYDYSIRQGWRAKSKSDDLVFGGHFSKAVERYHRERAFGATHADATRHVIGQAMTDSFGWQTDNHNKNRFTLIRSIVWYLIQYENDPCETIVLKNEKPAVELSFRFQVTHDTMLCGHFDRIVAFAGEHLVQDQKTTKASLGGEYFRRYDLDTQMSLYTIGGKVLFDGPIKGVMIDAVQVAVGFTRCERGFTYRTEDQSEEWLETTLSRLGEQRDAARKGWPMNDTACFLCDFKRVCAKSARVRETFLETDFEKRPWNPLEVR